MYNMQSKIAFKQNIFKCISVCGGVTGKYMAQICPDETYIFSLMKEEKLRRIPVEVTKNGKMRKIYLYEAISKLNPPRFPNIKQADAVRLAIANKLYFETPNVTWLDREDVKKFAKESGLETELMPSMMYYQDDMLVAIYINKNARKLSDDNKKTIENKLMVNKIIEVA